MSEDLLIMCEDNVVMRVNLKTGVFHVINESLIPYPLKGRILEEPDMGYMVSNPSYYRTQLTAYVMKMSKAVISWLSGRTLLLSRSNAKKLYNLIQADQVETDNNRAEIAIKCRAVSILDNYWLKTADDNITWSDVNLRHNSLNDIIAQVALHGKSLTLQGSLISPEFTTNGTYAKAWRRHPDDVLWLYKLGAKDAAESRIEVMCSNLLDKMNVEHVHYEAGEDEGKYVCMCPAMTSDTVSIVSAMDMYSYCNVNHINFDKFCYDTDASAMYKMAIVDFLISNSDRHSQNWGFYYNPKTMEILRCHPLFDHNKSFDIEYMRDLDAQYILNGKSMRETALTAMHHVDFHFTQEITREDFITDRQYNSFMERAEILGVKCIG